MRIFFFTLAYRIHNSEGHIYADLMGELVARGHEVHVFRPDETRSWGLPSTLQQNGVSITSIPTGKILSTNALRKLLNTMWYEKRLASVAFRELGESVLHLIIYATPPIHVAAAVRRVKGKTNCSTYLLLKDIFPANGADLGMYSRTGLIWKYFRRKESKLYRVADAIGCMSPANKRYLEKHNPWIDPNRIEICPNSIMPTPRDQIPARDEGRLQCMGIPKVSLNLIYGGNLGKPQGIDFLVEVLKATQHDPSVHITVIGGGTEFAKLRAFKERTRHPFALMAHLPKQDYQTLLASMDVGLIFLDHRFTIPNFPSRLLDYLDFGLPVLAATDVNTDVGSFLQEEGCGLWCESVDVQGFLDHLSRLKDPELRREMGLKSRAALESNFTAKRSADIILSHSN
jgi:glycosyltransferase involved in cell wall biosynthesis